MKLIQSLDITEGISMDSLKPIIDGEAESSLDSCLAMKDSSVDEHLLKTDIPLQINSQIDKSLTDIDVESIGNNAKKMFEKVDLNSSNLSLKKDTTWISEIACDKSSEKENMSETNEERFDFISDDESQSMHLKLSSDDETSIGEADIEKINFCDNDVSKKLHNQDVSVDHNLTAKDNSDNGEVKICSKDTVTTVGEVISRKLECSSHEEAEVSPRSQDASCDTAHVNSTDDFDSTPSCSKSVDLLSETTSVGKRIEEIDDFDSTPSCSKSIDQLSESTSPGKRIEEINDFDGTPSCSKSDDQLSKSTSPGRRNEEIDDFDKTPSCSKPIDQLSESTSPGKRIEEINDIDRTPFCSNSIDQLSESTSLGERNEATDSEINDVGETDVIVDEKFPYGSSDKVSHKIIRSPSSKDVECLDNSESISVKKVKSSDVSVGINAVEDNMKDSVPNHLDQNNPCDEDDNDSESREGRCTSLTITKDEGCGDSETKSFVKKDNVSDQRRQLMEKTSNKRHFEENHENIGKDQSSDNCDPRSAKSSKDSSEPEVMSVESEKTESYLKIRDDLNSTELGDPLLQPEKKSMVEKVQASHDTSNQIDSNSEPTEEMDCSEYNNEPSMKTTKSSRYSEFDSSSDKVLSKIKEKCKEENSDEDKNSTDPNEENTNLRPSSTEAASRRKRSSESCDEKSGTTSKRTKVSMNDNDDCDVLFEDTSPKKVIKSVSTKENKLFSSSDKTESDKISEVISACKNIEEMNVSESVEEKGSAKILKSGNDVKKDVGTSEGDKLNPLPFLRNFTRAQLQSMTRNDLEELVLQKICEAITERSVCGELRETAVSLDQKLKAWQKKCQQLTKQVKDLSLVLKRYATDLQHKGPNVVPVKITRSVGLQVQMPGSSNSTAWNQDDPSLRKGEKGPTTSPTSMAATKPGMNTVPKSSTPASPTIKLSANPPVSPKVAENAKVNLPATLPQNSQPPSGGVKVLQTKSPTTPTTTTTTSTSSLSKTSQKIVSTANNRIKPTDLQVIDLTDAEDKSKSTSISLSTTSTTATDTISSVISTINSSPVSSVGCRSIRVLQHLSTTSTPPLVTQTVTTAVAGQRVAYYVPSPTLPQRQLIISNPPARPAGVVVSRQNSIPAIVLKSGPMVPVSAVSASNANLIRASNVNTALQLATTRPQQRATHYLQRVPVSAAPVQTTTVPSLTFTHPAPLPPMPTSGPNNANWKLPPPKPDLKISKVPNRNQQGIVLSWNMTVTSEYEEIASYQLFAYQEGSAPPSTHLWKKVGDVKALPLPMACTLTQFMEGHKYHFAVRAVDIYARYGPFSSPGNIVLTRN